MYQESAFIPTPPNETKNTKSKKMTKFSRNDKKKKTLLCYNALNTFQMYSNECQ
ncbi:hypothetical protein N207_07745 [Helicobacter pylori UM114]|uniref:Uncharacterized protein n=1 Tax=Helicobacter pylori UM114 TaxID=1355531 RepID=T0ETW6_HELPX|nr:hypothetical protein N207_07745 [Helicobacter pylori UM114]